jgi:hypothetical protein
MFKLLAVKKVQLHIKIKFQQKIFFMCLNSKINGTYDI